MLEYQIVTAQLRGTRRLEQPIDPSAQGGREQGGVLQVTPRQQRPAFGTRLWGKAPKLAVAPAAGSSTRNGCRGEVQRDPTREAPTGSGGLAAAASRCTLPAAQHRHSENMTADAFPLWRQVSVCTSSV